MTKKALIIFGTTGSLVRKRIFPALNSLQRRGRLGEHLQVIGYGRKDFEQKPLENFSYVKGELTNLNKLVRFIKEQNIQKVFCLVALPPGLYYQTNELIQKSFGDLKLKTALEKPFGYSLKSAKALSESLMKYGEENFYLIDHYLTKQSVINFSKLPQDLTNTQNIMNLEVSMFESGDVSERGALYDELGAIKDTGQSHILNMAASFFGRGEKLSFLKNLKYKNNSLILGQYDGYRQTPGVKENSETETYFKASFTYKGVNLTLRSGKALDITRTFIKVFYKNLQNLYIEVGPRQVLIPSKFPWLKERKDAHEYVLEDFLKGDKKFSITINEALEAWRVVEQMWHDSGKPNLKIYSRGASFKDIEG